MINPLKNTKIYNIHKEIATYQGVINKTFLLMLLLIFSSLLTIKLLTPALAFVTLFVSAIPAFILILLAPCKWSYKTIAIPFSILEGISIGALTFIIESKYPGVGIKAISATLLSFITIYYLYSNKVIKVTDKLIKYTKYGLILSVVGLISIILLTLFKVIVLSSLTLAFIFVFILILGLSCLLIDFDDVFKAVTNKVNKDEEWTLAVSLILSIVLIYESFLRIFGFSSGD